MSKARIADLVFSRLSADSAVTAVIGTDPVRVYPLTLPQDSLMPSAVQTIVSDVPTVSLDGYSNLRNTRVQLDVYAKTYDAGQDLADLVEDTLSFDNGPTISSRRVGRRDSYEDEPELHRVSLEFSLWSSDT